VNSLFSDRYVRTQGHSFWVG